MEGKVSSARTRKPDVCLQVGELDSRKAEFVRELIFFYLFWPLLGIVREIKMNRG